MSSCESNDAQRVAHEGALRAVRGLAADPHRASFVEVEVAQGRRVQAVRGAVVDLHAFTHARAHAFICTGGGARDGMQEEERAQQRD